MITGLATKVTGNTLLAIEWDSPMIELEALFVGAGQSVGDDTNQLELAIAQMASESHFFTVGGSSTAITLAVPASRSVGPEKFREGMIVRWRPAQSCPGGAMTVDLNGMGAKDLKDEAGVNLIAGVYDGLSDVQARYDVAAGDWFLENPVQNTPSNPNLLENSDFSVWQHLSPDEGPETDFTVTAAGNFSGGGNDDYDQPVDRWHLVSDGDDIIDFKRSTGGNESAGILDVGMRGAAKLLVNATNKKFGLLQNVESHRTLQLHNNALKCSLSFKVRADPVTPGNLKKLKAGVISSTTPSDIASATPIAAWSANGTNPTLISGHQFEATPVSLGTPSEGSWTLYKIEDIDCTTANWRNLKVIVWIDDPTDSAAGDILRISEAKLEDGIVATPFERALYSVELDACKRQFQKLGYGVDPESGSPTESFDGDPIASLNSEQINDWATLYAYLPVPMARKPLNSNVIAVGDFEAYHNTGDDTVESFSFTDANIDFLTTPGDGHLHYIQGNSMIRGQAFIAALPAADASLVVCSGWGVDADGFIEDGIFIRTEL